MIFPLLLTLMLGAFTALAWCNNRFAILTLLALTPTYLVRFSLGPIPITLLESLILIILSTFLLQTLRQPSMAKNLRTTLRRYALPLIAICCITVMSIIIAPNQFSALGIAKAYIVEPILLGIIIANTFTPQDYRRGMLTLIASGSFIGLLALLQVLFHIGIPNAWAIENRATSLFPYPNAVGLLLAPIFSAGIVLVFTSFAQKKSSRSFAGAQDLNRSPHPQLPTANALLPTSYCLLPFILLLGGIFAAKTEAALIAIPTALLVTAWFSTMSQKRKIMLTTGITIITILTIIFSTTIVDKLLLRDVSGLVRRSQWSETLHMLADRPFFGAGLNGYPTILAPYHDATFYEIFQYPHNIFLNVWSEFGLLGLMSLVIAIVLIFHNTYKHRTDPLTLACFAALLTMSIHGLVDVPFFKNDLAVVTVFFVAGIFQRNREAVGSSK